MRTNNRWVIAIAGVFLQIALGAVYAWSVFRVPLAKQFGWSISEITLTFTISIFVLGFAAFFGGLWLNRKGPRIVALTGGALYGLGVFLASFSRDLWWLYFSYGVIGGIGLGLAYIVPVAVLVKWFPDRRGLITGIAVGGFGAGALITAPVATRLIQSVGVLSTFAYLGIAYLIVTLISGFFMQNPPDGWKLEGWTPTATETSHRAARDFTLSEALKTWQWYALWLLLFLNTCAGISVISQEAPIFQELTKVSAVVAGGMVGIASLGNAVGRVFWAWVSDLITRRATFLVQCNIDLVSRCAMTLEWKTQGLCWRHRNAGNSNAALGEEAAGRSVGSRGRDRLVPLAASRRLHAAVAHSELRVLPRAGHCPQLDDPVALELVLSLTGRAQVDGTQDAGAGCEERPTRRRSPGG